MIVVPGIFNPPRPRERYRIWINHVYMIVRQVDRTEQNQKKSNRTPDPDGFDLSLIVVKIASNVYTKVEVFYRNNKQKLEGWMSSYAVSANSHYGLVLVPKGGWGLMTVFQCSQLYKRGSKLNP